MGNMLQSGFGIEGGISALHTGEAQDNTEQYKANLAQQNAAQATAAAQSNAAQAAIKGQSAIGKGLSQYAAAGVRTDVGSPMAAIAASASQNTFDQMNIIHKGDITATNFQNEATQDLFAGNEDLKAGRNNMFMNFLSAGLTAQAATPSGSNPGSGAQDQQDYEDSDEGTALQDDANGDEAISGDGSAATESLGADSALDDVAV